MPSIMSCLCGFRGEVRRMEGGIYCRTLVFPSLTSINHFRHRGHETAQLLLEECMAQGGLGGSGGIEGGTQRWAAVRGKIVVLATPFSVTAETLAGLRGVLEVRS